MQLYALCDEELLKRYKLSIDEFVSISKKYDAKIIQYRNKTSDINFIKKQLIAIRKIYDGFLIVNDIYELVPFCDGVHMGQNDLRKIDADISKALKILRITVGKEKIIGISTHNEKEVLEANTLDLNYIGLGAYRNTSTKKDISAVLGSKIDEIAKLSKHPVAAIGGVKIDDKFKNITYNVVGSGLLG